MPRLVALQSAAHLASMATRPHVATTPPQDYTVRSQLTDTVVMVPPEDFAFNEQTARDNDFQHAGGEPQQLRAAALAEFATMVQALRAAGITVLTLEKSPDTPPLPDAVFPNNWFSTWPDGQLWLYPMRTPNRQAEVRPAALIRLLSEAGYAVATPRAVAAAPGQALEGTGALVFDHPGRQVFAARSERCDSALLHDHATTLGYTPVLFSTRGSGGRPFYHTNVMLSVGERFAVACLEAVPDPAERARLRQALAHGGRELIEFSLCQTEQGFCANLLQLSTGSGPLIVLSQTAYDLLEGDQRARLARHGRLLPVAIPTIERVGGGSARCMLAEVFLPRRD